MDTKIKYERVHFFSPSINICMVATIGGSPSEKAMNEAIGKAFARHEILGCRIIQSNDGTAYYSPLPDAVPRIQIRKLDDIDTDWIKLIHEQERVPFDWENGELIRFFVLGRKCDTACNCGPSSCGRRDVCSIPRKGYHDRSGKSRNRDGKASGPKPARRRHP